MFASLQNPLTLVGRVLLALLFFPSGKTKNCGFSGTQGYIATKRLTHPTLGALISIVV